MKLLYITSGKNGITSFTFKELELLDEHGVEFMLLFTKFNKINNTPKKHWKYILINKKQFLINFIFTFWMLPFNSLFYEALKNKELKYFLIAKHLKIKVLNFNPEFVHVQMGDHKLILAYYLNKFIKTSKLSATIHAHELYSEFRYDNSERYKYLLNECTKVFTISDFNKNILIDSIGVDSSKVDKMYLYPSFQKTGLKDKKKILMTGNWEYKKGFLDVLDAIKLINRDDFVLLIAGRAVNPDVDLDLPKIIKNLGLENKIKLLGHINSVVLEFLYSYCDIFLLPSKTEYYINGNPKEREGIPVAIMEAVSFNMPVITTKHAGIPELVKEYLVEEGNVEQIKQSIELCLDNPEKAKLKTLENSNILNSNFTFKNINALLNYFKPKD